MREHWLVRPSSIRLLWIVFGVALALTVAAEAVVDIEAHFPAERTFGFGAWYGFLACAALILGAKALGVLLKRAESYYREDAEP